MKDGFTAPRAKLCPMEAFTVWLLGFSLACSAPSADRETLKLWNEAPPLARPGDRPEAYLPLEAGMDPDLTCLGMVSEPSLTVYQPPAAKRNSVTVVVRKYRVPSPKGEPAQLRPLLDAQRAMSLTRTHAKDWGVDPKRVGGACLLAGSSVGRAGRPPNQLQACPFGVLLRRVPIFGKGGFTHQQTIEGVVRVLAS